MIWLEAARPKTLPAALAPVLVGVGYAIGRSEGHALWAWLALVGAALIQIGTNYANDYFDGVKGTDNETRVGPRRAVASGLVTPAAMKRAFVLTFALAIAVGALLVWRAGWPIALIGLSGIALGVLYTGGPKPLGYLGLGDALVLAYFGPIAVAGTHYVQALRWDAGAFVAGLGPGLLSVALLAINNLRDEPTDRVAGKRTLAVRFGRSFAMAEIATCYVLAMAMPGILIAAFGASRLTLMAAAVPLLAIPIIHRTSTASPDDPMLDMLARAGRILTLYGVLLAVGLSR